MHRLRSRQWQQLIKITRQQPVVQTYKPHAHNDQCHLNFIIEYCAVMWFVNVLYKQLLLIILLKSIVILQSQIFKFDFFFLFLKRYAYMCGDTVVSLMSLAAQRVYIYIHICGKYGINYHSHHKLLHCV